MAKKTLTILSMIALVSCATIVKGGKQDVTITTVPKVNNVKISVKNSNGIVVGEGQDVLNLKLKTGDGFFSGAEYDVTYEAPGYEKKTVKLETSLRWGWYFLGNAIFGGLIGYLIVDPLTGAMYALDTDDDIFATSLTQSAAPEVPAKKKAFNGSSSNELKVVSIDMVPEHLKSKMVRVN